MLRGYLKGYLKVMFRMSMKVVIECMYSFISSSQSHAIGADPRASCSR
jgi:hypothetical protein